jgi:hypothetical protein
MLGKQAAEARLIQPGEILPGGLGNPHMRF